MITLDGSSLSLDELASIADGSERAVLAPSARRTMALGREVLIEAARAGENVYGTTTGVAERRRITLDPLERRQFSHRLIEGHRVSQGPLAPPSLVRAAMICLANGLASGVAGVRPEVVALLLGAIEDGFVPRVRTLGSVGQADLGPMADLAHGLLDRYGFTIEEGEGLPLISNNAFSTGWSALAMLAAERLLGSANVAAALDLEAFASYIKPWDDAALRSRPFPGVEDTFKVIRTLLAGSILWERDRARYVQDTLTFRSIPQVHGAARDALRYARSVVEIEMNAFQGDPAVLVEERRVVPVANFDPVAMSAALDFVRIALASVVNSACERTVKLLQAPLSGLATGLSQSPESGDNALAELAVASQSLAVEARMLAQPVSFELASTFKAEGTEDRTTMAPLSARRLEEMVDFAIRVLSIELTVASQAIDLRKLGQLGEGTRLAHAFVRSHVAFTTAGSPPPEDLEPLIEGVRHGALAQICKDIEADGDEQPDR